jgi:excisionase family DNA binding protein
MSSAAQIDPLFLTRRQVAEATGWCERTIAEMGKDGTLPEIRRGRSVRYAASDVKALREKLSQQA